MENLKFKTNIKCGGCVAAVTPFLNKETGIQEWNVDTTNAEKILTVKTDGISAENIIKLVEEAGYKAEKV